MPDRKYLNLLKSGTTEKEDIPHWDTLLQWNLNKRIFPEKLLNLLSSFLLQIQSYHLSLTSVLRKDPHFHVVNCDLINGVHESRGS